MQANQPREALSDSANRPIALDEVRTAYDLMVVGTSPMSLVEAASAAARGQRVCIVDRETVLGGAWRTEDCMGLAGVETTPHVFVPDWAAFDILERLLGSRFTPLPKQPYLQIIGSKSMGDRCVPINQSLGYIAAVGAITHLDANFRLRKRLPGFLRFVAAKYLPIAMRRKAKIARYPTNGLTVWFAEVKTHLEELGVDVFMNFPVRKLEVSAELITAHARNNLVVTSRQVCINRSTSIEELEIDGALLPIENESRTTHHFTFVARSTRENSFVQVIGHQALHLISDVSDFAPDLEAQYPGCRLLTVRLHAHETSDEEQAMKIFELLREIDYVEPTAEVVKWHHRQLAIPRMKPDSSDSIAKALGKRMIRLEAGDLSIMESIRLRYS